MIREEYNEFRERDIDIQSIDVEAEKVNSERLKLENDYNSIRVSVYNAEVEAYNSKVVEYNTLYEKLGDYISTDELVKAEEMSCITDEDYTKWTDEEMFFNDVNSIEKGIVQLNEDYYNLCVLSYNGVIDDYNTVATAYNDITKQSAIAFIDGIKETVSLKERKKETDIKEMSESDLCNSLKKIVGDTDEVVADYIMIDQITNPSEEWVKSRLKNVKEITALQSVTKDNDPDGLMGLEGGYKNCIYFQVSDIAPNSVKGISVVEKGTDAGGAVEIYSDLKGALNRCDYLSGFDNTLLYSGSYAAIGTMVIRTSYKLDSDRQVYLTNEITKALTSLE